MSSAPEDFSGTRGPAQAGAFAAAEQPHGATGSPATAPAAAPTAEGGFWDVPDAPDFDPNLAEQHASKVFALWELAPAPAESIGDSPHSDQSRGAEQVSAAASVLAREEGLAVAGSVRRPAATAPGVEALSVSVESSEAGRFDSLHESPARRRSGAERHAMVGVAALVVGSVIAGAAALFSPPSRPPSGNVEPEASASTQTSASTLPAVPPVGTVSTTPPVEAVGEPRTPPSASFSPNSPSAPMGGTPAPRVTPPPGTRWLRVRTTPPHATLLLDGANVSNPFTGELPLGSTHTLVASAEGYRTATVTIALTRDQNVVMQLERVPPPSSAPAGTAFGGLAANQRMDRPPTEATSSARSSRERAPRIATPRGRSSGGMRARGAGFVTENPY
jgi:hypothetical protein